MAHYTGLPTRLMVPTFCLLGCALGGIVALWAHGDRPVSAQPGAASAMDPEGRLAQGARPNEVVFSAAGCAPGASPLVPAESPEIVAEFVKPSGGGESPMTATWSWNGAALQAMPVGPMPPRGDRHVRLALRPPGGQPVFGPGIGELEVACEGRVVVRGSFTTAPAAVLLSAQKAPETVGATVRSAVTARAVDMKTGRATPEREFSPSGRVWVAFDYQGADPGGVFTVRWFGRGNEMRAARTEVTSGGEKGTGVAWLQPTKAGGLPEGDYSVTITYGGQSAVLAQCNYRVSARPGRLVSPATPTMPPPT